MEDYYNKILFDPNEKVIKTLGEGYLKSVATSSEIQSTVLVLSDRRVYFRGAYYDVSNKKLNKTTGSSTVNIEDITGLSFEKFYSPIGWLLIAFGVFIAVTTSSSDTFQTLQYVAAGGFVIGGIISLSKNSEILVLKYPGGSIAINTHWFSMNELLEFQKAVIKQKRILKEGIEGQFKECKFCAEKILGKAIMCKFCGRMQ